MKPILFKTTMVKALLDGRKTITRRVVKFQKHIQLQDDGLYTLHADGCEYENQVFEQVKDYLNPPYKVGDVLYVRETFKEYTKRNYRGIELEKILGYKTDEDKFSNPSEFYQTTWKPSIHMPKSAARIFLKVTGVRVERLQEIDGYDAFYEGAQANEPKGLNPPKPEKYDDWSETKKTEWVKSEARLIYMCQIEYSNRLVTAFSNLWNSTIKKQEIEEYGWDANPWVWVIKFERCEKLEAN